MGVELVQLFLPVALYHSRMVSVNQFVRQSQSKPPSTHVARRLFFRISTYARNYCTQRYEASRNSLFRIYVDARDRVFEATHDILDTIAEVGVANAIKYCVVPSIVWFVGVSVIMFINVLLRRF